MRLLSLLFKAKEQINIKHLLNKFVLIPAKGRCRQTIAYEQ